MRVFRLVKKGHNILQGPWSDRFKGQTIDNLYSVAKGRGKAMEWAGEVFAGDKVNAIDIYEIAINPRDVIAEQNMGELLVEENTLRKAKVLKITRLTREKFQKQKMAHRSESRRWGKVLNDTLALQRYFISLGFKTYPDTRFYVESQSIKKMMGTNIDPWTIAKAVHEKLGMPVKNQRQRR